MKNIVFMMNIDLGGEGRYSSSRSKPYQYSINSWKKWCDTNNVDLFVLEESLLPISEMGICWQRYYLFDILEQNDINYNQVLMVDSDTIVHPKCPNFFKLTNGKYGGVATDGSYDWIFRSIENYSTHIFNNYQLNWWQYINGGFQIVSKNHRPFFNSMVELYHTRSNEFIQMQNTYHVGTDQTPLNFMLQMNDIELEVLSYEFNMQDLANKEILDENLSFTDMGWIYHFNAIPNNTNNQGTLYWMEKTYTKLYGNN